MKARLRVGARAIRILLIAGMLLTMLPTVAMAQITTGISGTVTDANGGAPLEGVTVFAEHVGDPGNTMTTLTNAQGGYELDVPAGEYDVVFGLTGYVPRFESSTVTTGSVDVVDVALTPLGDVVSGTITDSLSDDPLTGVTVEAYIFNEGDQQWEWVAEVTTDANGDYAFTNAQLPEGTYVIATAQNTYEGVLYQTRYYAEPDSASQVADADEVVVDWAVPRTGVDIALDPPAELSGQVICAAAQMPMPGTTVNVDDGLAVTTTDDAGMYEFLDLPAGPHTVVFSRIGFLPVSVDVVIVDGESTVQDVELSVNQATAGQVQGFVTDAESTDPIPGATVTVNMGWTAVTTGGDGSYGVFVPEGTHMFEYSAPGYESFTEMVTVPASSTVQNDVALEPSAGPSTGDLHGVVEDESGEPLEGVLVEINDGAFTDMTDALGVYDFMDLPAGQHDIRFSVIGFETLETTFTIVAEQTTHLDVTLEEVAPDTGDLSGMVEDAEGAPIEGALVLINDGAFSTTTDDSGHYSFTGLPVGTHDIRFVADGFEPLDDTFVITAGGSTVLDVMLVAEITPDDPVARIWDDNRFSGSVAIAESTFDTDPDTAGVQWGDLRHIVIASGEDRAAADPLAAAGLCGAYDAPLFLVSRTSVTPEVEAAIGDIVDEAAGNVMIHVVGGPVSVPNARITEIQAAVGAGAKLQSERILSSGDRYDLAGAIAVRMADLLGDPEVILLANGADSSKFFDALALSPIAAAQGYPILLVSRDDLPDGTVDALDAIAPDPDAIEVIIGGGPATVSTDLEDAFEAVLGDDDVARWSGATRYETAIAIADGAVGRGWLNRETVGVAAKLPDALSGGAAVGLEGGVLVLTESTRLTPATRVWLETHAAHIQRVIVFGGPLSVVPGVVTAIEDAITP